MREFDRSPKARAWVAQVPPASAFVKQSEKAEVKSSP
jgi:hypothetical protein